MVLKELILKFYTVKGCGDLERTDFLTFYTLEGVVVLKELIFNIFYFGMVLWS